MLPMLRELDDENVTSIQLIRLVTRFALDFIGFVFEPVIRRLVEFARLGANCETVCIIAEPYLGLMLTLHEFSLGLEIRATGAFNELLLCL